MTRPTGPLAGLKVLAFEHAWAAPYGTMMLADMGADVAKVEQPGLGDHVRAWTRNDLQGLSPHFLSVNRNKRSIVIDLKSGEGLARARDLARRADVVVENFSPGTLARLGLGYDAVRRDNPAVVYCSVSGFGTSGPYRDRRAYDLLVQAEGGLMSVTGESPERLAKVGVPVVDIMAAMVAAFAVVCAVREREQHGRGRHIDVAMLDVAASVMAFNVFSHAISGEVPRPLGTAHPLLAPYEIYATRTGPVAIAILTEAHWATFCGVIQRPDLQARPDFATAPMRVENRDRLNAELRPVLDAWDQTELIDTLARHGLACAHVNDVPAIVGHPQLAHRGFFADWEMAGHRMAAPGAPWRATAAPGPTPPADDRLPAEKPGADTDEVLRDWGVA
ncbi:CaiB/BaiF CoA transferase family protein [Dactylosporangium sp. CS-033363]|uniref:CaiB/BaiF CoA transferase family protein n=1 Tax=Dactylosporangium sp. CS-033363 TaxID=3239935 RepID=UPI003D900E88